MPVPYSEELRRKVIPLARCDGLDAVMTGDGATDADVFRADGSQVLAPTVRPGDLVVMDHLSAHKVTGIETAITAAGAKLIDLPPSSPDFRRSNPAGLPSKPAGAASRHAPAKGWIIH